MTPTIVWDIHIDWDAEDWSVEPDFSEDYDQISGDVDADGINFVGWERGKQREKGNAPAATCEIRLKPGLCAKYSPFTADADLQGKVRPWLPVRIRAYHNAAYTTLYTGFISRINLNPHPDIQSVILYCTDGTDLLARQMVAQDTTNRTMMSDGDAIDELLDAAGWNRARRNIDKDGGDDFVSYPASTAY